MEEGQELQEASEVQTTGVPVGVARAAGLIIKEDTWEVERTVEINRNVTIEKEESGRIPIRPFVVPPEVVGVSYGVTVNLGNFNFGRASVWRSRPCYTAEVEECYRLVSEWAGEKITEEQEALRRLREKLGGGGGGGNT